MAVLNMGSYYPKTLRPASDVCGSRALRMPIKVLRGGSRFFEARGQKAASLDEATIRKLAS